jgi:hypothetical protein
MDFKKSKFEDQFSEGSVFVEELIHENIKLFNQNLGLIIDNNELVKRVEELERNNEELRIGNLAAGGEKHIVIVL